MTTDVLLLNALVGIVLPLVVALVTAKVASPRVKSSVLLLLSAVGGYLTTLLYADVAVDWQSVGSAVLAIFITAVASFFGFTSPAGVAGSDGAIQARVSGGFKGFGKAA